MRDVSVEGSSVKVLAAPQAYLGNNGIQYWAKVEAKFEPKQAADP